MTAQAGELHGREHRLDVRIYYEDTDFTGVVYHGAYVRFLERGRSDFLRCIGISHADLMAGEAPTAFSIIRLAIDFRRAARIDDALVVRTTCHRASGARLFFRQSITRDEALIAEAQVEAVCIDPAGGAKRPPKRLMGLIQPFLSPDAP